MGDDYRFDVSIEAGTRWDTNSTGFRAEEEIGFDADAPVLACIPARHRPYPVSEVAW